MTKEFMEVMEAFEKGEDCFALSNCEILGEELAIIEGMGEQLTLYTDLVSINGNYKKGMYTQLSLDALLGLGLALIKTSKEMREKIDFLDFNCDFKPWIPDKEKD